MRDCKAPVRNQKGFTLVEAIITVAVIGILVMIGVPTFIGSLSRSRLTGTAREVATLMQVARLEAIKLNAPTEVNYDATANQFFVFVDIDRNGVESAADHRLTSVVRPSRKIQFRGPADAVPNGPDAIDIWDDAPANTGPIFNPDGSADRAGAYRFHSEGNNYIEVRIETPATGRIALRKWDSVLNAYFAHLESNRVWIWHGTGTETKPSYL